MTLVMADTDRTFHRADPRGAVIVNGRFLRARPTGVQRVAGELLRAVDRDMSSPERAPDRWSIVAPADTQMPPLGNIPLRASGRLEGHIWEQVTLPWLARDALLVNLCNTAPLIGRRMVTMIHDAQAFTTPESYSRGFSAWYRFLLPRVGARSDFVLTVSEFSRQQLAEYGVAPLDRIRVIHNGVDHFGRTRPDSSVLVAHGLREKGYVLSLGNMQAHKNVAVLLRAFAKGAPTDLKLVLVGHPTAEDYAKAGLELSDSVVLVGSVSDPALCALIDHALCFACPSKTEGFGLPPLEAMARGRPTVVAPCGALTEVCGVAAMYADPTDEEHWRGAFLSLAEDGQLWNRYASLGRQQGARFTWRAAAERLQEIVNEVA